MNNSQEAAGYKLFVELYKKKRVKDGRRTLEKKELDTKVNSHWQALSSEQRTRYCDEAIRRMKKNNKKKLPAKKEERQKRDQERSASREPRRSRENYRSRSPIRICRDHSYRSRSSSVSSARTEYLGGKYSDYTDYSSYTDTTSGTYYDDEYDCCSDATSCSSIDSCSYDDELSDVTQYEQPKPCTSAKASKTKTTRKTRKGKVVTVTKKPALKKTEAKEIKKRATKRPTKKTAIEEKPAVIKSNKKVSVAPKDETKKRKLTKSVPARASRRIRAVKKTIPLKKKAASLNVNVKKQDLFVKNDEKPPKPTLPVQSQSDSELKPTNAEKEFKLDEAEKMELHKTASAV